MKIEINVPDGVSGEWAVETFCVTDEGARFENMRSLFGGGRRINPGEYKRLMRGRTVVMSNTPAEIGDHIHFIRKAQRVGGSILINGLGIGMALSEILKSDSVTDITVIEKSEDVISLSAETYLCDSRVDIVHADAFDYKPEKGKRFNAVWHDIWDYICGDNLPEMTKLHRKYGRKTDWQDSWCKDLCKR